jgi:membrane-bound lytic murein transglycosylase MltF
MRTLNGRWLLGGCTLVLFACGSRETPRALASDGGAGSDPVAAEEQLEASEDPPLVLRVTQPLTDDWPEIERRGVLRVLVPRDRTNFFFAQNRLRGMEYELVHEFERSLKGEPGGTRPQIDVAYVPVEFNRLLPALLEGLGDVAAGGLTITAERAQQVAFTQPYLTDVAEVVVASSNAPPLTGLEGLAGQLVIVGPGSSFLASLEHLNQQLEGRGLQPARVESPGRGLQTEDMLELVNSGAFPYTVADQHVAELWSGVLTNLRVQPQLQVATGGQIAWAVRRDNPELKSVLDAFLLKNKKGTSVGNTLFQRYFKDTKWIDDPGFDVREGKLGKILEPVQRISAQYGFDWRLMVAQAYQESHLDPGARSHSGAIGLMQLLPSTAKDMGFDDVTGIEDNLAAGIKYMAWLRDNYFSDPQVPEVARVDFALAAYNAGPGRVRRWRREAPDLGVDANRWFGGVENIAQDQVGFEPVHYVANINKYFVILTRMLDERERKDAELEKLGAGGR